MFFVHTRAHIYIYIYILTGLGHGLLLSLRFDLSVCGHSTIHRQGSRQEVNGGKQCFHV